MSVTTATMRYFIRKNDDVLLIELLISNISIAFVLFLFLRARKMLFEKLLIFLCHVIFPYLLEYLCMLTWDVCLSVDGDVKINTVLCADLPSGVSWHIPAPGRHRLYRALYPGEECPYPHLPPKSPELPHNRNDLEVMEHEDRNQ